MQSRAIVATSFFNAPSWRQIAMSPDFRGDSGEMCELLHTSLGRPKNNGLLEE
jgi:hypothetical protein